MLKIQLFSHKSPIKAANDANRLIVSSPVSLVRLFQYAPKPSLISNDNKATFIPRNTQQNLTGSETEQKIFGHESDDRTPRAMGVAEAMEKTAMERGEWYP